MNDGRVYSATFSNTGIGASAASIMEVQVPDNSIIEVIRAWVSAEIGAAPTDEVANIAFYGNDAAATAGTGMTEQPLTPAAAADASNCTALLEPTIGATPLDFITDAFHLANGWLYLPVPEERVVIFGGSTDPGDNVGLRVVTAAAADVNLSGGMIWREWSAA